MTKQTTIEDYKGFDRTILEEMAYSYSWNYGVITKLSNDEIAKLNHLKKCALCNKGEITHDRISGGIRTLICTDCAVKYVHNAEKLKKRLGL